MIRVIPWCGEAQILLSTVEGLDIRDVREEVEAGISQLWECQDSQGFGGYVVTRLEQKHGEKEWVWLACAGRGYHRFVHAFLHTAQDAGLPIRVYVRRPGMRRIYEKLNFSVDATVMRRT